MPKIFALRAVHRQTAASRSTKPPSREQQEFFGPLPRFMPLTKPSTLAQAPSFSASTGHLLDDEPPLDGGVAGGITGDVAGVGGQMLFGGSAGGGVIAGDVAGGVADGGVADGGVAGGVTGGVAGGVVGVITGGITGGFTGDGAGVVGQLLFGGGAGGRVGDSGMAHVALARIKKRRLTARKCVALDSIVKIFN
ncbi:uncharacterized protein LOC144548837 [Carex rostrata]